MKKTILTIAALSLLAAAIVALPVSAQDQVTDTITTNAPAAPVKHKKHDHLVFNGKLSMIDTNAMTLTVGARTFEITSDTKITKDGKPAALADGVVGDKVGGAYKKGEDGKLTATSIRFGGKSGGEKKHKKKTGPDAGSSTNSVPD